MMSCICYRRQARTPRSLPRRRRLRRRAAALVAAALDLLAAALKVLGDVDGRQVRELHLADAPFGTAAAATAAAAAAAFLPFLLCCASCWRCRCSASSAP